MAIPFGRTQRPRPNDRTEGTDGRTITAAAVGHKNALFPFASEGTGGRNDTAAPAKGERERASASSSALRRSSSSSQLARASLLCSHEVAGGTLVQRARMRRRIVMRA